MATAFLRKDTQAIYYKLQRDDGAWRNVKAPQDIQAIAESSPPTAVRVAKRRAEAIQESLAEWSVSLDPNLLDQLAAEGVDPIKFVSIDAGAVAPHRQAIAAINEFIATGRPDLEQSTRDFYAGYLRIFLGWLKERYPTGSRLPLSEALSAETLHAYAAWRADDIKARVATKHGRRAQKADVQALAALEKWAYHRGLIEARGVRDRMSVPSQPRRERKLPTEKQLEKLLADSQKYKPMQIKTHNPRWLWIHLAIEAGMRIREIRYLQWKDFDLDNLDEASVHLVNKPAYGFRLKNNQERTLPIRREFAQLIIDYREKILPAFRQPHVLVFNRGLYKPDHSSPCPAPKDLKRVVKNAGIEWDGLHTFRVLACVRWFTLRIPPAVIARLMGHNSLDVTYNVYGNHIQGRDWQKQVRELLEK